MLKHHEIFKFALENLLVILYYIGKLIKPLVVLYGNVFYPKRPLPPFNDPILELPAVDLAEKLRNRELRSADIVASYIARIKQVNPLINAVVEDRFPDALEDARRADEQLDQAHKDGTLERLKREKPILGIPFTVKESCCIKGLLCTQGSRTIGRVRSPKNGKATEKLLEAGGIPLCVTNTPEYCYSWESFNFITGRTLNPYDQRRTPGGSSGGEAALLGAGGSLFGIGSDLAGSIRLPAFNCGVYGHKPTPDFIPTEGHMPVATGNHFLKMLTIGPMCRYSKDLPMLFDVLSDKKAVHFENFKINDVKIFYKYNLSDTILGKHVNKSLINCQKKAVQHFESLHMDVKEMKLDFSETLEISLCNYMKIEGIPDLLIDQDNPKYRKNIFIEMIKCIFGKSDLTLAGLYFQFLVEIKWLVPSFVVERFCKRGLKLKEEIIQNLANNGVLLFPTYKEPATRHYYYYTDMMTVMYASIFNVLHFPSTNVTMGLNNKGIPIGFQVVAAPGNDHLCFKVAQYIEENFGGWRPPAPV